MISSIEIRQLIGFYENELTNRFLSFWFPRCIDSKNGGFFNCFDNSGEKLISKDKYTWSQGRFIWIFSKLASTTAPIFTEKQRIRFMNLAENGADFLMKHCLIDENDWRCVFLLDESGNPKYVTGCNKLDMSIYADCFTVAGLAKYSAVSGNKKTYNFAENLYDSILKRIRNNTFETLPYPLSKKYRAHGIPMILSNISKEMAEASEIFKPESTHIFKLNTSEFSEDVLTHFVDGNYLLHEVITADNRFFDKLLGQHINPGHTIEDAWFMLDAQELAGKNDRIDSILKIVKQAMKTGWDEEFGGILHFADCNGGQPKGDNSGCESEPMSEQLSGWSDKLWWIHSEALYTLLRCCFLSKDENFLELYRKVFDYTYRTFPNDDPEIREWIQIRMRNGMPMEKIVALPVKDPYHIMRNLILIIELLYKNLA